MMASALTDRVAVAPPERHGHEGASRFCRMSPDTMKPLFIIIIILPSRLCRRRLKCPSIHQYPASGIPPPPTPPRLKFSYEIKLSGGSGANDKGQGEDGGRGGGVPLLIKINYRGFRPPSTLPAYHSVHQPARGSSRGAAEALVAGCKVSCTTFKLISTARNAARDQIPCRRRPG